MFLVILGYYEVLNTNVYIQQIEFKGHILVMS